MQERISLLSLGEPNVITLRIQPDDGICLQFGVKPPGLTADLSKVAMRFSYEAAFGKSAANGYERLLLDAMLGDATLFSHRDGVEAACAFHSGP
jgi:glucose-6-phosphate 1-dehydrogenase